MIFTLTGRVPSKKNSKMMICRGNRPILLSSKAYSEWHEEKSWELKTKHIPEIKKIKEIIIKFFAPDARKSDCTNKAESIMDLLVDNKIIEDDSWFVVPRLRLEFGGIDRKEPRTEIIIK